MRRSHSIRNVMLRHFILSSLLPAVLLSVLLCGTSFAMMVRQAAQTNLAALELAARSIETRLESIVDLAIRIPTIGGASTQMSSDSLYWLVVNYDAESDLPFDPIRYVSYSRIRTMINQSFLQLNPYINGIHIIIPDGPALSFGGNFAIQRAFVPLLTETLEDLELPAFVTAGLEPVYAAARTLHSSNVRSCLTYFSSINSLHSQEPIAVLAIDMDDDVFDALGELSDTHEANVYAVDADGATFFSACYTADNAVGIDWPLPEISSVYDWHTGSILCTYPLSDSLGGITLRYSAGIHLIQTLEPALLISLVASILLVSYVLLATLQNTRRFSRPIVQLSRQMIASDQLPNTVALNSDIQEFRILYDRYNEMLASISSYIDQKYANEMLLIRAKMQAMEAQIDSHFLYNTLECIYSMALLDGANDVARVVKSLSGTLRYISRTENATVTVRQELNHLQDYVAIQQARLGDDINCIISVDDSILDRKMLKLSLQPLVENAFKHGFASSQHPYNLRLNGELRGDNLVFSVHDNGVGMTEEKLQALRQRLQEHSGGEGVGLVNIANRLRIYYGGAASLNVESVPNHGTLVTMTLPEGVIE